MIFYIRLKVSELPKLNVKYDNSTIWHKKNKVSDKEKMWWWLKPIAKSVKKMTRFLSHRIICIMAEDGGQFHPFFQSWKYMYKRMYFSSKTKLGPILLPWFKYLYYSFNCKLESVRLDYLLFYKKKNSKKKIIFSWTLT